MNLTYPVVIQSDGEGGFVGEIPDAPGTRTFWPTQEEVLYWIQDALVVMLSRYIDQGWDIPKPSEPKLGQPTVSLPPLVETKLTIYQTMREQGVTEAQMCEQLHCDYRHLRRLLDLNRPTRLDRIEAALSVLGKRLTLRVTDAA